MIRALPSERYRIGIGHHSGGDMQTRTWSADQLKVGLSWLARQNAKGFDIYVMPEPEPGGRSRYILVDDITSEQLARMRAEGYEPALVTETSRGNHQCWMALPEPVEPARLRQGARDFTKLFGGDPASAAAEHFGRLPGFTNRKPKRQLENGHQPFVLVRDAAGQVFRRAGEKISEWRRQIVDQLAEGARLRRAEAIAGAPAPHPGRAGQPADAYRHQARRITADPRCPRKQDGTPDWSRIDFLAAQRMAAAGWSADQVGRAIVEASPEVGGRHPAPAGYAKRTAKAAAGSDWVRQVTADRRRGEARPAAVIAVLTASRAS